MDLSVFPFGRLGFVKRSRKPCTLLYGPRKGKQDILVERRAGDGEERKAGGEKTGHQVSQSAKEIGERQNQVKTGEEEVGRESTLLLCQFLNQGQVKLAFGTPAFHAFGNSGPEALVEGVGVVGEFLGLVGFGELLHC